MEELVVLLGETTSRHPPSSHLPFLDNLLSAPWVGGYALEPTLLETGRLWRCVLRIVSLRPSPAVLAQGGPIFHSGCEGKLGSALELLQGKSDLI